MDVVNPYLAKPRSPTLRSERDIAPAAADRSPINIGHATGSAFDVSPAGAKTIREKESVPIQVCRILCHVARGLMRQINTLDDQSGVLPCGLVLRASA